jgi:DNA-binding NarL/FixJ family response regulator
LDNLLNSSSLPWAAAESVGKTTLVLLAPQNLLIDALKSVFSRSELFSELIHHTGGESFDSSEFCTLCPLTTCFFIDSAKDLENLRRCQSLLPGHTRIIAVCAVDLQGIVLSKVLREGADSMVCMSCSLDELMLAIERTSNGEKVISKRIEGILVERIFDDTEAERHLTKREQQVLQMVCDGQTMKEIAYELKLSPHTIQYYHRSVMEKVGVNRTADLIVYAMRSGLY